MKPASKPRPGPDSPPARPRSGLLLLTVFFTGLLSLACQLIWLRKLSYLFGSTATVFSTVVSIFLLGLALGALAAGRVVDRGPRPWRLLGLLQIGIGAYCLLSLPILDLGRRLFLAVFPGDLAPLPTALGKLVIVLAAMILPTLAIGAVFPLAVRLYGRDLGRLGRDLSLIYGLEILGAALGALLAGFLLVPGLGLAASTWLLGLVAIGLGLLVLVAKGERGVESPRGRQARRQEETTPEPEKKGGLGAILAAFFLSGLAVLLLETGWYRFFSLLNGPHVYSTSTVLAGFLTGIGAGGLLMARWIDRIRDPFAAIAWLYGATALCGMLVFRSEGLFTRAYFGLFQGTGGYYAFQLAVGLVILLIVFLATLAIGASFPLAVRIATRTAAERGAAAGRAFFANTLGAVLGALLAELVLLPAWGFSGLLLTTLALYAAAAAVFLALSPGPRRWASAAICAVLLGAAFLVSPVATPFRMPYLAPYSHGLRDGSLAAYRKELAGLDPIEQKQGLYGQVAIVRRGPYLLLENDGRTEASTALQDNRTRFLLGHLPMLFHPNPRRVLAIGLGGGVTLRALVHHPEPERITVAEIDPLVVDAARLRFAPYNNGALEDRRVRVVIDDGRDYLDGASGKFDVITSEPPGLWVAGASGLFTREFYRSAAAHLSANGVLCQWVPLYEMERQDFRTLLHTIHTVFPNIAFWKVGEDVVLLASPRPFLMELEPTVRRLRNPGLARDFSALGLTMRSVVELLNSPVARPDQVDAFLGGEPAGLNVDDKPVLEFSTARNLYKLAKKK